MAGNLASWEHSDGAALADIDVSIEVRLINKRLAALGRFFAVGCPVACSEVYANRRERSDPAKAIFYRLRTSRRPKVAADRFASYQDFSDDP